VRPRSEADVIDVLRFAHGNGIPVTAAGGQTSVTGSSVAQGGILLATEGMDRLLDIGAHPVTGRTVAVAEPGIFLGDFQRTIEDAGWFYPPDPTSRNEARLGATVATNATGEDTLLYGPTRVWIRELRVVRADGTVRTLTRGAGDRPSAEKGGAGYYLAAAGVIDHVIGSEGTLAVVTRVTVDLVPRPPACLAGIAFFPSLETALAFVAGARTAPDLRPRALELLDAASLALVRDNAEGFRWPEAAGAAIVFKQEYADDRERERVVSGWLALLERILAGSPDGDWVDHVLVTEDSAGLERLRAFRHRVPASVNERLQTLKAAGGGKVATDWWVPAERIPRFLPDWTRRIAEAGLDALVFGHIGNGHPHVNFLPRSPEETERARGLVRDMCREAVALGGGVAGEHGLGKIKRDLLAIQHPRERIQAMVDIKKAWDPRWILGRGNLFDPSEAGTGNGEATA
jgi:FAD/FMN-containing dehydrogenase